MRKIIHVDMDAFYASIEQRDDPRLMGKPVIVGGEPRGRGVVAACSYEAREYGIHSAMASTMAYRACPQAIFVKPRFDAYRSASSKIMSIFREVTEIVQPLSLDEAYLDVTDITDDWDDAVNIAISIRNAIKERTDLTASAGISFNKFLAKVASDVNKPDGFKMITQEDADSFIDDLPIRKFYGIGKVTEEKMLERGIIKGSDLKKFSKPELVRMFGRHGAYYYDISHNLYDSPVANYHQRRSISTERTLHEDIDNKEKMLDMLSELAKKLESSMKKRDLRGNTITLKMRYSDFSRITRSETVNEPLQDHSAMMKYIPTLLGRTQAGQLKVRLLGIGISNLINVPRDSRTKQVTLDIFS